jgi:hypothetical protein
MRQVKQMSIAAGFVALLVGFLGVMQNSVPNSQTGTSPFNATTALTESIISLTPLVVLVLAAAFILAALRVLL